MTAYREAGEAGQVARLKVTDADVLALALNASGTLPPALDVVCWTVVVVFASLDANRMSLLAFLSLLCGVAVQCSTMKSCTMRTQHVPWRGLRLKTLWPLLRIFPCVELCDVGHWFA